MAIAKIQLPDGRIAQVEIPAGMSSQDAQSQLQSMYEQGSFKTSPTDSVGVDMGNDEGTDDRSLQSSLVGGAEVAGTLGSSILAEPLAGIAGLAAAAIPGGRTGPEAIEDTRNALRYEPKTQSGQEMLRSTGEALAPVGEAFESAENYLGDAVYEKTGSPALAAAAKTIPTLITELVGVGGVKATRAAKRASKSGKVDNLIQEAAPSTEQLREVSSALYKEVDEMGAMVDPNKFRRLSYEIAQDIQKQGADPRITPASSAVAAELFESARKGEPISLQELNTFREMAKGAAGKVTDKHESMLGGMIVERIDDFMGSSGIISSDMSQSVGAGVGQRLKVARELWGRMRRSELLEEAGYRAENAATGYENGLRNSFRSILNNKKQRKFFKAEELKTMEDVVRGTTGSNMLKRLGKLGFGEGAGSNMLGGGLATGAAYAVGGVPAAMATAAVGTAARKGAQVLTDRRTRMADSLVRAGSDAKAVTASYLKSASKPDPAELAEIFLRKNVDFPDPTNLDEFTRKAVEIAAQRKAEMLAAAGAGSSERGINKNATPFAIGQ